MRVLTYLGNNQFTLREIKIFYVSSRFYSDRTSGKPHKRMILLQAPVYLLYRHKLITQSKAFMKMETNKFRIHPETPVYIFLRLKLVCLELLRHWLLPIILLVLYQNISFETRFCLWKRRRKNKTKLIALGTFNVMHVNSAFIIQKRLFLFKVKLGCLEIIRNWLLA